MVRNSESNCADPTGNLTAWNVEVVSGDPISLTYGTSIQVKCKMGFRWSDNSYSDKIVNCTTTKEWTYVPSCKSKFHSMRIS